MLDLENGNWRNTEMTQRPFQFLVAYYDYLIIGPKFYAQRP